MNSNEKLEQTLLAALLTKPSLLPDVAGILKPEMFISDVAGWIYTAIMQVYNRGEKPDYLTVENELRRMDARRLKKTGGIAWLGKALVQVQYGENAPLYAGEIRRLYLLRQLAACFNRLAGAAILDDGDPLAIIGEADDTMLQIRQKGQCGATARAFDELVADTIATHRNNRTKGKDATRVLTGLREFDAIFGGMHNGELFVCGGRPGDGKTALSTYFAIQAAQAGKHVCIFSLEMKNIQVMNRVFAGYAEIDPDNLRASYLTEDELEKMEAFAVQWKGLPLYIDYTPGNTVQEIRSTVLLQKKRGRCDFIIVDHLHLMEEHHRPGELPAQTIGRIVKGLKRLALEADCPVLLLSQMNREVEKRTDKGYLPQSSDLRDSGAIEQDADAVFFIHRPMRFGIMQDPKTGESLHNVCYLIVRKHRNGHEGVARVRHNSSFTRFTDMI